MVGKAAHHMDPAPVLDFWFGLNAAQWWRKDAELDADIRRRFGALHSRAAEGGLADWEATAQGAMALILVLDQFSRNIHRDSARAFACDERAVAVAERAIARGFDAAFPVPQKRFMYLPFMHAEDLTLQERCLELCRAAGDGEGVEHARIHADIIRRFGRFPHRNRLLGRATRPEEQAFLDAGGFAG